MGESTSTRMKITRLRAEIWTDGTVTNIKKRRSERNGSKYTNEMLQHHFRPSSNL
jgi:hypothetical protein